MTKQEESSEMKYRLSIYILQVLLDRGDITTEEAIRAKNILLDRRKQMEATAITFSGILFRLAELPQIPMEFNETLWHTLVDHVTVYSDERIVFTFTDGTEIVTML